MTDGKLKLTIAATEYDLVVEGTSITYVQRIDIRKGEDYERCKEVAKEIVHCVNSHDKLIKSLLEMIGSYQLNLEQRTEAAKNAITLLKSLKVEAVLEESTHG